jgi:cysteine synthase A
MIILAAKPGGHYMDPFTFAERATEWRGNNNIAESIYSQMSLVSWTLDKPRRLNT